MGGDWPRGKRLRCLAAKISHPPKEILIDALKELATEKKSRNGEGRHRLGNENKWRFLPGGGFTFGPPKEEAG